MTIAPWLQEVQRLETQREIDARVKAASDREILLGTAEWIRTEVAPAMTRFGDELRTLDREVIVTPTMTSCRVTVRDPQDRVPEFVAEVGTESAHSTQVRDRMPTMSTVFYGLDRIDVDRDRIYELLKISYLSKLRSNSASI